MNKIISTKTGWALAIAIIATASSSMAQTVRKITLQEAVEMSLKSSKKLRLSQTNVDLAGLNIKELKDNQLPSFTVSGSYLRMNTPDINLKMSGEKSDSTGSKGMPKVNQVMYGMASASLPIFSGPTTNVVTLLFLIESTMDSLRVLE